MPEITNKSAEQKAAEAEVESFRKDLGPFVVAAETSRMAMVFTDAKEFGNPIIFANDSFLSLTGYDREEVLGQSLKFDGHSSCTFRARRCIMAESLVRYARRRGRRRARAG